MQRTIRIGTRESQLAVWQASLVKAMLEDAGFSSELIYIKSEGDVNLTAPLYAMGVQGVFTRSLDIALLNNQIDIAVHSMKDVPVQLPRGIVQAAVLKRASHKDILVYKGSPSFLDDHQSLAAIATCSIRRRAQWLNRYPGHSIYDIRGNVNTRLRKLEESDWNGAVFAAAGLERIGLRPSSSVDLDWMLPAPAQGAIMIVCREQDDYAKETCSLLNDSNTEVCVAVERAFLAALMGGCSTPISALAEINNEILEFRGNIVATDGSEKFEVLKIVPVAQAATVGINAANDILENGGAGIVQKMKHVR